MGVNGITAATYKSSNAVPLKNKATSKEIQNKEKNSNGKSDSTLAAVYEKSSDTKADKTTYKQDTATIAQLKEDAERRTKQLRDLVEKMMLKQGQTFDEASMYKFLREGNYTVDEETVKQAQADVSEDGYWGVEQTSDRLVSFAKALTGGDPDKADEMMEAIQKGFDDATKTWGDELPDICKQTLEATKNKIDTWKNSVSSDN